MIAGKYICQSVVAVSVAVQTPCIFSIKQQETPSAVKIFAFNNFIFRWIIPPCLEIVAGPVLIININLNSIIHQQVININKLLEFVEIVQICKSSFCNFKKMIPILYTLFIVAFNFLFLTSHNTEIILDSAIVVCKIIIAVGLMQPGKTIIFAI